MVDNGEEVRGPRPVREYTLQLHARMQSGEQRALVVTEGQAFVEGDRVNSGAGDEAGLAYCLVYDISDNLIAAMWCYGTIARLMPAAGQG